MKMTKRRKELEKLIDSKKIYPLEEAVALLKQSAKGKFDETVEMAVSLGIDARKTDQAVRKAVALPHGTGKTKRVVVIATGEKLKEAEEAGADFYGKEEILEKISKGWLDFDAVVATPDVMKDLAKLGKVLGPRGLMPNPKTGTVTFDVGVAVSQIKKGRIEIKNDKQGVIHAPIGKISFDDVKIAENAKALIAAITAAKPSAAKGQYVKSVVLSSTMGPGIKINL